MVRSDEYIFDNISSFKKALRENRFSGAEQLLGDIRDQMDELQEQRRQQSMEVTVKHRDKIGFEVETSYSNYAFIAYGNLNKKFGYGDTPEEALIDFSEKRMGEQ